MAREFLSRLSRERQISRRIDDNGDLVARRIGTDKTERHDLMQGAWPRRPGSIRSSEDRACEALAHHRA